MEASPSLCARAKGTGTVRGASASPEGVSGYTIDPVALIDFGDRVVAVAQVTGVGPVSQLAMDGDRLAFLFTITHGRVVREQAFRNRDEALEAAGLRD